MEKAKKFDFEGFEGDLDRYVDSLNFQIEEGMTCVEAVNRLTAYIHQQAVKIACEKMYKLRNPQFDE